MAGAAAMFDILLFFTFDFLLKLWAFPTGLTQPAKLARQGWPARLARPVWPGRPGQPGQSGLACRSGQLALQFLDLCGRLHLINFLLTYGGVCFVCVKHIPSSTHTPFF